MQIKQNYLSQHLQKKLSPIYWLVGQDTYFIEDSLNTIKNHIKNTHDCEESMMYIQSADEWRKVVEEANNYSLFSEATLLNVIYDKKSMDSASKKIITDYLKNPNSRCFIIIRTPNIPAKQLSWITPLNDILSIIHYPLNNDAMTQWINNQLRKHSFTFDSHLPALITQYSQGNMLACAQVIEKLSLCYAANTHITTQQGLEHVFNQCEHSLYELTEAFLLGRADKSIQILRHAANNKTEATLVLWMLTQEIRLLLQLNHLLAQHIDMKTACARLKIWPQRISLYQSALKRISHKKLQQLIQYSLAIDEQIKSNLNTQMWNSLERIVLGLC